MTDPQSSYCQHAQRILSDGLRHAASARAWAREVLETASADSLLRLALAAQQRRIESVSTVEAERYGRLSAREHSLGVTQQGVLS